MAKNSATVMTSITYGVIRSPKAKVEAAELQKLMDKEEGKKRKVSTLGLVVLYRKPAKRNNN